MSLFPKNSAFAQAEEHAKRALEVVAARALQPVQEAQEKLGRTAELEVAVGLIRRRLDESPGFHLGARLSKGDLEDAYDTLQDIADIIADLS